MATKMKPASTNIGENGAIYLQEITLHTKKREQNASKYELNDCRVSQT